jgi:hypothetical protein
MLAQPHGLLPTIVTVLFGEVLIEIFVNDDQTISFEVNQSLL